MSDDYIEIDAEVKHQTDDAFLLDLGGDSDVWVPKSVCDNLNNLDEDTGSGIIEIKEWWLAKEDLL